MGWPVAILCLAVVFSYSRVGVAYANEKDISRTVYDFGLVSQHLQQHGFGDSVATLTSQLPKFGEAQASGIGTGEHTSSTTHVHDNVKTIIVTKKVPVPYTVQVEKKVPYAVKVPVRRPYAIYVPKPYVVEIPKPVPYAVKVPIPHPFTVEKHVPIPYRVPVDKPYPVQITKPYPVVVEKKFPITVEKPLPIHVKVPIEKPVPIPVPVDKKVQHPSEKPHHDTSSFFNFDTSALQGHISSPLSTSLKVGDTTNHDFQQSSHHLMTEALKNFHNAGSSSADDVSSFNNFKPISFLPGGSSHDQIRYFQNSQPAPEFIGVTHFGSENKNELHISSPTIPQVSYGDWVPKLPNFSFPTESFSNSDKLPNLGPPLYQFTVQGKQDPSTPQLTQTFSMKLVPAQKKVPHSLLELKPESKSESSKGSFRGSRLKLISPEKPSQNLLEYSKDHGGWTVPHKVSIDSTNIVHGYPIVSDFSFGQHKSSPGITFSKGPEQNSLNQPQNQQPIFGMKQLRPEGFHHAESPKALGYTHLSPVAENNKFTPSQVLSVGPPHFFHNFTSNLQYQAPNNDPNLSNQQSYQNYANNQFLRNFANQQFNLQNFASQRLNYGNQQSLQGVVTLPPSQIVEQNAVQQPTAPQGQQNYNFQYPQIYQVQPNSQNIPANTQYFNFNSQNAQASPEEGSTQDLSNSQGLQVNDQYQTQENHQTQLPTPNVQLYHMNSQISVSDSQSNPNYNINSAESSLVSTSSPVSSQQVQNTLNYQYYQTPAAVTEIPTEQTTHIKSENRRNRHERLRKSFVTTTESEPEINFEDLRKLYQQYQDSVSSNTDLTNHHRDVEGSSTTKIFSSTGSSDNDNSRISNQRTQMPSPMQDRSFQTTSPLPEASTLNSYSTGNYFQNTPFRMSFSIHGGRTLYGGPNGWTIVDNEEEKEEKKESRPRHKGRNRRTHKREEAKAERTEKKPAEEDSSAMTTTTTASSPRTRSTRRVAHRHRGEERGRQAYSGRGDVKALRSRNEGANHIRNDDSNKKQNSEDLRHRSEEVAVIKQRTEEAMKLRQESTGRERTTESKYGGVVGRLKVEEVFPSEDDNAKTIQTVSQVQHKVNDDSSATPATSFTDITRTFQKKRKRISKRNNGNHNQGTSTISTISSLEETTTIRPPRPPWARRRSSSQGINFVTPVTESVSPTATPSEVHSYRRRNPINYVTPVPQVHSSTTLNYPPGLLYENKPDHVLNYGQFSQQPSEPPVEISMPHHIMYVTPYVPKQTIEHDNGAGQSASRGSVTYATSNIQDHHESQDQNENYPSAKLPSNTYLAAYLPTPVTPAQFETITPNFELVSTPSTVVTYTTPSTPLYATPLALPSSTAPEIHAVTEHFVTMTPAALTSPTVTTPMSSPEPNHLQQQEKEEPSEVPEQSLLSTILNSLS